MAQQYGYGYGQYQAYGYGQHAVGYSMQPMQYGQQQRASYSGQQVSYPTSNTASFQAQKPAQSSVPPPPPPPGASQASTFYSTPGNQGNQQQSPQLPPQQQPPQQTTPTHHTHQSPQQQSPGYYGYQAFRPSAPHGYQSSYYQQHQSTPSSHSGNVGYPISTSSSTSNVPYSSTGYASAANTYYRQKQNQPPHGKPPGHSPMGHGGPPQQSGGSYTPQQKKVIEQYIQQKQQGSSPAPGGPGGPRGPGGSQARKPFNFVPQQQQPVYYCETCKISCASAATYKTHLEGKLHKKKQEQKSAGITAATTPQGGYFCQLCDVVCTGKDAFEAHIKGAKHTKVVTLHRRLGKPIPEVKMPTMTNTTGAKAAASIAQKEGKTVQVARITFIGGQKLTSTGQPDPKEPIKVYPPGAAVSSVGEGGAAAEGKGRTEEEVQGKMEGGAGTAAGTGDESAVAGGEEPEPDPVGEHLVVTAPKDTNFPHARYKCTMCDCFFNDEYAKRMHVKGRRHRLNYKKTYQPDLYVEPTKQQKRDQEKRRKSLELRRRQRGGMVGGSPGGPVPVAGPDVNELRRQEAAEIAKMYNHRPGPQGQVPPEEFGPDPYYYGEEYWGWESDPFAGPPLPQRNPRDDKLVLNKHGAIHPTDAELTAVQHVVADTEKALKLISDDLLADKCKDKSANAAKEQGTGKDGSKEESLRDLKGVMRVGAFARGLLLKGECSVQLVLMCAEKPTLNLFNAIAGRLPAKFESLQSDNVYNVTPEPGLAELIIISQVEDYRVQINLTFTSTHMRDEPTPEQAAADKEAGVLDRSSGLAALAALRHTKWFQAMAHGLPSCVIIMRVLKDISRRVPAWGILDYWMLELLVQKSIVSATPDFTRPGDVFRRVMECVASGLFLPGGNGLLDPCEKGKVDAAGSLTAQERANITLSAQHALRLIAFEKLHLVLGVDPLPPPGTPKAGTKRRAEEEAQNDETEAKKAKLTPEPSTATT